MKVSASVYMTVKIEVYVGDWDAAQPFEQLHVQASTEAKQTVDRVLRTGESDRSIKIVNEPCVMHVVTKEKQS